MMVQARTSSVQTLECLIVVPVLPEAESQALLESVDQPQQVPQAQGVNLPLLPRSQQVG